MFQKLKKGFKHYLISFFLIIMLISNIQIVCKSQKIEVISNSIDENFNIAVCRQLIQIDKNGDAKISLILICSFEEQQIAIPRYKFSLNLGRNVNDIKTHPNIKENRNYSIYFESHNSKKAGDAIIEFYLSNNVSYFFKFIYLGITYNVLNFVDKKTEWFESPEKWELLYRITKDSEFDMEHQIYITFPEKTRIDTSNLYYDRPSEKNEYLFLELMAFPHQGYTQLNAIISKNIPNLENHSLYYFKGDTFPDGQLVITYNTPNYLSPTLDIWKMSIGWLIGVISIVVAIVLYLHSRRIKYKMPDQLKTNLNEAKRLTDELLSKLTPTSVANKKAIRQKKITRENIEMLGKVSEIRGLLNASTKEKKNKNR